MTTAMKFLLSCTQKSHVAQPINSLPYILFTSSPCQTITPHHSPSNSTLSTAPISSSLKHLHYPLCPPAHITSHNTSLHPSLSSFPIPHPCSHKPPRPLPRVSSRRSRHRPSRHHSIPHIAFHRSSPFQIDLQHHSSEYKFQAPLAQQHVSGVQSMYLVDAWGREAVLPGSR